MVSLLKMFGKGILYVIGFPFFIVALLIFGVVGIFLFIFQLFKSIIYFFTGQKFFPELPEDKELRLKREAAFMAANGAPVPEGQIFDQDTIDDTINSVPPTIETAFFDNEPPAPDVSPFTPIPPAEQVEQEPPVFGEPSNSIDDVEEAQEDIYEQEEESLSELSREEEIETTIETAAPAPQPVEEEEELEEYVPKGTNYIEDIEEEDTHNGVDIDYDVR